MDLSTSSKVIIGCLKYVTLSFTNDKTENSMTSEVDSKGSRIVNVPANFSPDHGFRSHLKNTRK